MRTKIHRLIIFSLLVTITFSCSNTQDDLFDEPASLRLEKNKEKFQKVLEEPNQDWLLQYFPHPEQKYGGINYYLKFKDGKVIAQREGSSESKTSLYSILNRGGSVLSFYAFNDLLHQFANPTGSTPKAEEGDFEFLILNKENDTINLKGIKTGNYLKLIKLKKPIEEYEQKVSLISSYVDKLSSSLNGTLNGKEIEVLSNYRTLTIGDKTISYNYTDKGLHFYKPVEIEGNTYSELFFDKEANTLSSTDGSLIINLDYSPIHLNQDEFYSLEDNFSPKLRAQWDKDKADHKARFNTLFALSNYIKFGAGKMSFFVQYKGRATAISYYLNFNKSLNDSLNNIIIEKDEPDLNWDYFNLNATLNSLVGEFKVELIDGTPINILKKFKLTSVEDPEIWFILQ